MTKPQKRQHESGNALWFILLAVALMSALTAVVSRSSDTAEQSGNYERYRVQASDIMRHASGVKQGIEKMRLNGASESRLSFENNVSGVDYTNANAAGCLDCLVYSSTGGGVHYSVPKAEWLDSTHDGDTNYGEWEFTGTNNVPDIRSTSPELIMYVAYLKEGLCEQINTMLDITGIPVDGDGFDATAYTGSFASSGTIDNMDGLESGCFQDGGGGASDREYVFYQVLVRR